MRKRLIDLAKDLKGIQDPRLYQFETEFLELIELLMFSLIKDKDNFFGNISIQLHRKVIFNYPAPAAVSFRGTYFDLILNPLLLLNYNLTEMKAIIVHECYHIMMEHIKRTLKLFGRYPRIILNLGLDAAINQLIAGMPKGCVTLENLRTHYGVKATLEAEREGEYYINKLMEEYKNNPEFKKKMDEITQSEQGGGQGQGSDDGFEREEKDSQSHDAWEESDQTQEMENMKDVVKSMANQAAANSRGLIPGRIQQIIKKLNEKPILPWQDILRRYVGTIPVPYKKTIMRRDRRQPSRGDLRGRLADHVAEIVVAIDTSGSMSDKAISYCINEVFDIVKNTKATVTIVECDASIGRVYEATSPQEVQTKVTGRGGTIFQPVFDWIRDNNKKRSILIYFTDGGGEGALRYRPVHFKTLWIITTQTGHMSLREPYGEIRELHLDDKWKKLNQ